MKILLGTTSLDEGKPKLQLTDSKGYVPLEKLELSESFYGGRTDNLAKTSQTGVYLIVEGEQVIDVLVDGLDSLTKAQISHVSEIKFGKEIDLHLNKDEMIKEFMSNTQA